MSTVRRVYFLFVAAASLGMLITGVASIGSTLIEWVLSPAAVESSFRETIARSVAFALVGLPIWALHWSIAQRSARQDRAERASGLRRLYLYGVSAALLIAAGVFGVRVIEESLFFILGDSGANGVRLIRAIWTLAICAAFWALHV